MSKKAPVHYINNKKFYEEMVLYKKSVDRAKELKLPPPSASDYIGEAIYEISNRLSMKHNFVNYTYRDEMVSDGIENAIMALDNFDPDKYNNPFAYFTQIIYYAFLRRLEKEKKQSYIKRKALENFYFDSITDPANFNVSFNEIFEDEAQFTDLMNHYDKKEDDSK